MTPVDFARSQARGLAPITTRRGSYGSLISRVTRCKSTGMMALANTEDPWIDHLIISRLGGCYATPIIQIFQDGRFGIKIDPQLESATQPKARGYSIWSAILQSHFHIISTSRLMSWTTFQPRGSSSTIEDFSKNYSKRLQDYSNYYSRLQCARGLVGHTPQVLIQGRMKTDSY
jgi:hypothetical protein